jgi:hypothetical protein
MTDANHTPRRTVRVPDDVWQPAQKKAATEGTNVSAVVNRGLVAYIEDETGSVIHACPVGDGALTPCCGKSPFELPGTSRMSVDASLVTCTRSGEDET